MIAALLTPEQGVSMAGLLCFALGYATAVVARREEERAKFRRLRGTEPCSRRFYDWERDGI